MSGKGILSLNPPYDPNAWMACDYPERPWDVGISFHLRPFDECRACAIAWLVARSGVVDGAAKDSLDREAARILAGQP